MRIIAGKYKGKKLAEFELGSTRPTADMVREALFDKIGFYVEGGVFLDLFAGTGAVGLEAASRGAKAVYFVDKSKEAVSLIKRNLSAINLNNLNVYNNDFSLALGQFGKQNLEFDIIFLDPPYATDFAEVAIEKIKDPNLKKLVITNTVPLPEEKRLDKIEVLDIAPLFGRAILNIHQGHALGELFEDHKVEF